MSERTVILTDEAAQQKIVSSEVVFEGRVWDVRRDEFEYNGSRITREYVDHTGAVAVLAMDENDRVLLIQQYRHPIAEREWELPAGLRDVAEEEPLLTAQRELGEEADLVASEWNELISFHSSPGGSNELIRVYLARGLVSTKQAFDRTEEEADILVRWVPLADVVAGVLAGNLRNSILALAVLAANARR